MSTCPNKKTRPPGVRWSPTRGPLTRHAKPARSVSRESCESRRLRLDPGSDSASDQPGYAVRLGDVAAVARDVRQAPDAPELA